MWIGTCVHQVIEATLRQLRDGSLIVHFPAAKQLLLSRMRQDFANSRAGSYRERKACGLLEHEYDWEVSDHEWRLLADTAVLCLENFYKSEFFLLAEKLKAHEWLEVEEFSSFQLDGVKVHVVLDFSYRKEDNVFLVDWKTGKGDGSSTQLQLACYSLYATEKWSVVPEKIHAIEFRLQNSEVIDHPLNAINLEEALSQIKESITEMQNSLDDVLTNQASEDRFAPTKERSRCQNCNFKKACRAWM
jgi:CRISPR/Cas system-associated exonuclease Cas4 (RecB family)